MIDIKYRIWIEECKEFHYWGFIKDAFIGPFVCGFSIKYHKENSEQYTGLKDMNGKEIFEKDIAIIDGIKCIIKWNKGCNGDLKYNGFYGFYGKDLGKIQGIDDHLTEVIGDIHENPELFENNK